MHLVAGVLAPALSRWLGRRAFLALALAPASGFGWVVAQTGAVRAGEAVTERVRWIPSLDIELALRMGSLQWVLALLVTGVGALILVYCAWYFRRDDTTLWRIGAVFTLFAGAMLGLVLSDDLIMLYVFWELTTVFSYLLVGHNPVRSANRRAAMQALLVTTFGGLAMLAGIIMIGQSASYRISELVAARPPATPVLATAAILMLVGALTKSAQIPFHFWLPGAMAAPTPVSAYLHAAAMVKAGIYLVAVLAPVFGGYPGWRPITIGLGAFTMLVGGWRALRQHDIKLLLAYGTVSQLGFLTAMAGIGTRAAALAAVALVMAHALFKSTLFLTVGIIDRATGTRDLRELSGLGRRMPLLAVVAVLSGLSMAGVLPMLGFVAKEAAFEAALASIAAPLGGAGVLLALVLLTGSVLTVAYTARFLWGAFAGKPGVEPSAITRPAAPFVAVPVLIAGCSLVLGFLGGSLSAMIAPYAGTLPDDAPYSRLPLWHGFTGALAMSLVSLALGLGLFRWRDGVARAQDRVPALVDGERSYNWVIRAVERGSVEATAISQRGSLPIYLATILLVVVAATGGAGLLALADVDPVLWDTPGQGAIALVMIVAAVLAARARKRLKTVILVGVTGYGCALLFLLHGAPDIALTQMLVETVSLVVFVLVLRRLPRRFSGRPLRASRYWRMALAAASGVTVAIVAIVATGARVALPISVALPDAAYAFGHGKNVVNVTLVDVRAWDTLGEVSVLVVAATGVASLVFVRTRNARLARAAGDRALRPERRSVMFEVITRLLFHVVVAFSLYLLFVGHNHPGGGFAGGLVAGLALLVRYLAGGRYELDEAAPIDAGLLVGIGLFVVVASALLPLAFGGTVLQTTVLDFHLPVWGDVHLVTALFFDIGVYLIVIGLLLDIGRSLGSGVDRQREEAAA
ncbi:Na+/H+ antiporter subunit A [Cumulibacter manganitolerans]|uniref:Na+/H+ antiporter subunit A n=1 Tax=Cumulibacter manganitolerans TaxID=1884992 RepID=UPI00225DF664|nr:Na+/H+ antiporter subunit A [Cumulibacter manganitolerans]